MDYLLRDEDTDDGAVSFLRKISAPASKPNLQLRE
jgi:hypothetical protein